MQALGAGVIETLAVPTALAQQAQKVEKIEVTGSNIQRIEGETALPVNAAYRGIRNTTLTLGVKNVFDTDPPYTRQNQSFQVGYDPALADPTGRFYYASVRFRFK
jgi:iron complex outermembrane receptor protein